MKKIMEALALALTLISFGGCAYPKRIAALEDQVAGLKSSRTATVEKVDQIETNFNKLQRDMEKKYQWSRGDQAQIEKQDKRITALEDFKADHDKRWPPPVKLKGK